MSNAGIRSATATTSCELTTIIEIEIGIFALLVCFTWTRLKRELFTPVLLCSPRSDCFSDSLKQRLLLQRLSKTGHKVRFVLAQPDIAFCGNQDCRNCDPAACEMLLQLQTVHLRHLEVNDQTIGKPGRQRRQQFRSRPVSSRAIGTRTQEPAQGLEHGRIIVHNRNPRGSFRHETVLRLQRAHVELALGPMFPYFVRLSFS